MWIALGEQLIDAVVDAAVFLWLVSVFTLMFTVTM